MAIPPGDRLRILAPTLAMSSFITTDFELLGAHHAIEAVDVRTLAGQGRALRALAGTDVLLLWFGSTRFLPLALAARASGRRVVIITGGYDVAREPAIDYGNMRPGIPRVLGRAVFATAHGVAAISEYIRAEAVREVGIPDDRIRLIPLGFRAGPEPSARREPTVLTLARGDANTIHRKGLLDVARTSRLLPDVAFVMAGPFTREAEAAMKRAGGPNLSMPGWVSDAERDRLMQSAAVYFQPSWHEGFGCSVAEAMLGGCVPVVSPRGSLPELVGETGLYVEPGDLAGQQAAVAEALGRAGDPAPRQRIRERYPLEARGSRLLAWLRDVSPQS